MGDPKICPRCLAEYKKSKEGKRQRSLKCQGLPNSYSKGNWPLFIYHNRDTRLCQRHHKDYRAWVSASYQERETVCKALGFTSYKAYISSPLWAGIRARKFAESATCFMCGEAATAIHHSSYGASVLRGECMGELHPVCDRCHKSIEYHHDGTKAAPAHTLVRARTIRDGRK